MKQRIITSLVLIPMVLLGLFQLSLPQFFGCALGIYGLAAYEWGSFLSRAKRYVIGALLMLCLGASYWFLPTDPLWAMHTHTEVMWLLYGAAAWWCLALGLVLSYPSTAFLWSKHPIVKFCFGLCTLIPFFWSLIILRSHHYPLDPNQGAWTLLFVMGLVWAADSGAYFVGKAFGKRKMAPLVSPNKTIEGLIGGLSSAAVLAGLMAWWMAFSPQEFNAILGSAILAVLASVLGDLAESMLKREAGIKDSSRLLPGHGGILDRIDSLTAALPIFVVSYQLLS